MLKILKKISFWYYLGLLIWLGIYLLRKLHIIIPIVNEHLTDLFSVPMFCYTIEIIWLIIFKIKRITTFKDIIFSTLYLTLLFEIICPKISSIYTSDYKDAICYLIGGFLYYFYLKLTTKSSKIASS